VTSPRIIRVLICEESEEDAVILRLALRRAGFDPRDRRVRTADQLRQALTDGSWDVVLAAYSLPGLGGMQALRIVREHDPDLPVLLVSGGAAANLAVDAMRAGANDYLTRDDLARLGPAVTRELRQVEQRRSQTATQQALMESETRFLGALDAAPTAMLVVDRRGSIVLANAQAAAVFDQPQQDLVGRSIETLLPEPSRDIHRTHREGFNKDPRTRRMGIGLDLAGRRRDGSEFPAEIGLSTFQVGDEPFVIAAVQDITDRNRLADQLRQAQKMDAIGRLTGGIAHDFNNLLTAMNGYSDLVLAEMAADDPLRADVAEIRAAGERAAALTRQLLVLGRRQAPAPRVLDLNDLVAELDPVMRRLVGEHIEYATLPSGEPCLIVADPGQIELVVLNLVINAREAMPSGGRVTVETALAVRHEDQPGEVGPLPPGRYAMVAVNDTGIGMDEETRTRVFEPFFTTKEAGKGAGLGLATAWGIVDQSGGTIWVESEPGQGSSFRIYLPAVDAPSATPPEPILGQLPRGTETILVVEDEDTVRVLIGEVLRRQGYVVIDASEPASAFAVAERHAGRLDLLISDIVMPGESGPSFARRLVASQPGLRVLFVSGYADEALASHGILEAGGRFLEKPFTPADLARRVREVLDAPEAGEPLGVTADDGPPRGP
jgi:two-component system cell cycle sensor histidine kinase/response regulator CckA